MDGANNDELRRERPERAASPQLRATPWVSAYKALRPVRAKVWAHLLFITFALTGRWCGTYVNPGRCPGLRTCWAFSPRRAARMSRTCGASAPEGGSYSRVGACPYLLEPIYEPCPCKGLISRQILRGKPRPRYAPLTGAAARIDELWREIGASPYPGICAPYRGNPRPRASQQFVNSFNSLLRRLRPKPYCGAARNPVAKIRLIRTRHPRVIPSHNSPNPMSSTRGRK